VLARLAVDDGEGAMADAVALEQVELGNEAWGGSFWLYGSILHVMSLAHIGRHKQARSLLRQVSTRVLSDNFPVVAHDCLIALAYIVCREGNQGEAARLLEPVLSDTRLRMFPMYFFVARFLGNLRQRRTNEGPALPTEEAFFNQATAGVAPDSDAASRIEHELTRFVLAADAP
jgi:hypothetical protein